MKMTKKHWASFVFALTLVAFIAFAISYEASKPKESNLSFLLVDFCEKHPDTSTWDVMHEAKTWYCYEHHQYEYWNGTHVVALKG